MKKERIVLLVFLLTACQAIAQQQNRTQLASQIRASTSRTNATAAATFTAPKPTFHLLGPAKPAQPSRPPQIEGMDTRAWTTVAETRTSRQAFPTGENHEAGLCLLWWGSEPRAQ